MQFLKAQDYEVKRAIEQEHQAVNVLPGLFVGRRERINARTAIRSSLLETII
jgi:hypothetical protein